MKKAFIDQIMLGLFLFSTLVILAASISDEFEARNKSTQLEIFVKNTTRALSKHYMYNDDLAEAQNITNEIFQSAKLGLEILSSQAISYTWRVKYINLDTSKVRTPRSIDIKEVEEAEDVSPNS